MAKSKARKTVSIEAMKQKFNFILRSKGEDIINSDFRRGVASAMVQMLNEADAYNGFNYLDWLEGGYEQWRADGCPEDNIKYLGDLTRVVFF